MKKLFLVLLIFTGCHYGTMEDFNNQLLRTLPCALQEQNKEVGYLVTTHDGYIMGGFWGHINSMEDKLDCEIFIKNSKKDYWCKPVEQRARSGCIGVSGG